MIRLKMHLLLVACMLLVSTLVLPIPVKTVNATQTGLICLADVTVVPSPPCSSSTGPIFDGPFKTPNQQIHIGVYANDSASFNVFAITLKANASVLRPAGMDLAGSILPGSPVLVQECLGSQSITGNQCDPTVDTSDTLTVAAGSTQVTPNPSFGLLFTAIYNITTKTTAAVTIGFQSGCTQSSVTGTSLCVILSNGSVLPLSPIPETVQTASFNNTIPIPYLSVTSNRSIVGPMKVGETMGLKLNLTGSLGWNSQFCSCSVIISSILDPSLHVKFNTTSVLVPSSNVSYVSANFTGSVAGNYSVTIFSQYSSMDLQNLEPDTLVAPLVIRVDVTDFALAASQPSMNPGYTGSSVISLSPENGFAGTVLLSLSPSVSSCSLNTYSVVLLAPATSTLNCSWLSTGNYSTVVNAVSGADSHNVQVFFVVRDFAVSLGLTALNVTAGTTRSLNLTLTGLNGFSQSVSLNIVAPSGVRVVYPSTVLALGDISLNITGVSPGSYTVNVTASSGAFSHSQHFRVVVLAAPLNPSPAGILGLPPLLFYSIVAAALVVSGGIVAIVLKRRKRTANLGGKLKSSSGPRKAGKKLA